MSHLLSITFEAGNLEFVFLDSAIWPAQWFDRRCRNAMVIPDVRARGPPQPGRSVSPTGLETPFPSRAINNGCAHPALRPRAPPSRAAWHFGVDGKKMEREREKDGRFVLPPSFLLSFFQRRSREFHVNLVGRKGSGQRTHFSSHLAKLSVPECSKATEVSKMAIHEGIVFWGGWCPPIIGRTEPRV